MGLQRITVRISGSHWLANANGVGLAIDTKVADIDIVIASGDACVNVKAGPNAQCDVIVAGYVALHRLSTNGRVAGAGCIISQCIKANGNVAAAGCVSIERGVTKSCVPDAAYVAKERCTTDDRVIITVSAVESLKTDGRVALASRVVGARVVMERLRADSRVLPPGCVVIERLANVVRVIVACRVAKMRFISNGRLTVLVGQLQPP